MARLSDEWFHAFQGCFKDEGDVVEFIFERLSTDDFKDSYIDAGGFGEPNEKFIITAQDKRESLYNFMMELTER